jgi:hypothetical protein
MKGPIVSTWRDVFSIAVKWRQVSEPCDSVVWVDMLRYDAHISGSNVRKSSLLSLSAFQHV